MRFTLTDYSDNGNTVWKLNADLEENSILLSITRQSTNDIIEEFFFRLEKKELSDFIGVLLHLQSKLKNK